MAAAVPLGSTLAGCRVFIAGRLAGMSKRDAQRLIRKHGGVPLLRWDESASLIVLGEQEPQPAGATATNTGLDPALRLAAEARQIEVLGETEFWQRLGLVEPGDQIHRLHTPGMLASLIGVPLSLVHRWHRQGLLRPTREVRRLPYFDFREVTTARRLAELTTAGATTAAIKRNLAAIQQQRPEIERPLADLAVRVEGKQILLWQGDALLEPHGQRRFDFDAEPAAEGTTENPPAGPGVGETPTPQKESAESLLAMAAQLEEDDPRAAEEAYRVALAAHGPTAEVCFALAELLYRLGDLSAARERYYMAIELDENYVEARSNLGCVLVETGQRDLAVAAFEGALAYHPDYPDAHYHLARALDDLGRPTSAEPHWQAFLSLAPDSPWADEAYDRLGGDV